ncbi:MAG: bifunctional diguanylate cyclase/phosphodiesterase, partial [Chromatiales bacterium]|nr:bifunctional diguanylate cyclase/phosphodiesterase [Chromatiales bacterium]
SIGDALLVEVGKRLQNCVRASDTIARLGGDEFVAVLEQLGQHESDVRNKALAVAEKIRATLGRAYVLGEDEHIYRTSVSIGVALFQGVEEDVDELIMQADVAMFEAKDLGRNRVCFFNEERQAVINSRTALVGALQHAIDHTELHLYYQPQVSAEGQLLGAEALLRWFPRGESPISPATFIPIAEETGLILPIGEWVLETACQHLRQLNLLELPEDFALAVNISARQFSDDQFLQKVQAIVARTGVDVSRLKLELTESCLVQDLHRARVILNALRDMGFHIELDDFGTGYSSLTSLKALPLDTLKLDGDLVHGIESDNRGVAIVRAAIAMAKAMSLSIVAEGVETPQQSAFLINEGCDMLQGFLFARPMPFDAFTNFLRKHRQGVMTDFTIGHAANQGFRA